MLRNKNKLKVFCFRKEEKQDLILVKSYGIFSLLNYMDKVLEKIIAQLLLQLSEYFLKLYAGWIRAPKKRCAIDVLVLLVYEV